MKSIILMLAIALSGSFVFADAMAPNQIVMTGGEAKAMADRIEAVVGKTKDGKHEADAKILCYKHFRTKELNCSINLVEKK